VTKVMVVDDEPDIRRLVGFSLKRHGFDIVEATDGLAACALAEAEQPDIILMDVMMPLMNGFEAVRKLKENAATADIPVVMLSAKSQVYEQEEGLESGAVSYICKPFTPAELVEQVSQHLQGTEGKG
jgi:two-component system alkaline phosphatase synthesis response regulator PhoP